MQKNVPKYTPDWVQTVQLWAETSKRDVCLRVVQRPPHVAVVRQPAGDRVPPDPRALADRLDHATHLGARPRSSRIRMRSRWPSRCAPRPPRRWPIVGLDGAVKTSGAKGLHVFVPIADGVSLDGAAAATRAIAARVEQTRFEHRHDRVHEGGPRREGVHRLDPRRRCSRGRRIQPTCSPRRARLVSDTRGAISTTHRRATSRSTRHCNCSAIVTQWDRTHAGAAGTERRPRCRRARHSHRSRPSHARRQTPRPPAARRGIAWVVPP